ncbi:MAG: alpha/beta hydrolase [Candidatus Methylacidiphilales bacterium]
MKSLRQLILFKSNALNCSVHADLILPPHLDINTSYPLLILNDGQDMQTIQALHILEQLWSKQICKPFILIAPHAKDRMNEYGVANHLDHKNRGALAVNYTQFVVNELIPQLLVRLNLKSFDEHVIGGFSLGALSAFDIAWNNSHVFSKVIACSGSFWWRNRDLDANYTNQNRIMHQVVNKTEKKPALKVWLQCGTLDETADRNKNGVIDSIDDTLDLIAELKQKGFNQQEDLFYHEVIGGRHTMETYSLMLPHFLQWAFPK